MDPKAYAEILNTLLTNLGKPSKVVIRKFNPGNYFPVSVAAISFAPTTPDGIAVVIGLDDLYSIGVTNEQINNLFGYDIFKQPQSNAPTSEAVN